MALTFADFESYPLEIIGITSEYDEKINQIESFVIGEMRYSGEADDVSAILKYFVFWFFCQDELTTVTAKTGETFQVQKTSFPDFSKQLKAWDLGAEKLRAICKEKGTTANLKYLKGLNLFV